MYQFQQQPYSLLKGRPVASIEEVKAIPIDFDGSIFYFPDLANRKIYTKQIGMDGQAIFQMYELKNFPTPPAPTDYVSKSEFEQLLAKLTPIFEAEEKKKIIEKEVNKIC